MWNGQNEEGWLQHHWGETNSGREEVGSTPTKGGSKKGQGTGMSNKPEHLLIG